MLYRSFHKILPANPAERFLHFFWGGVEFSTNEQQQLCNHWTDFHHFFREHAPYAAIEHLLSNFPPKLIEPQGDPRPISLFLHFDVPPAINLEHHSWHHNNLKLTRVVRRHFPNEWKYSEPKILFLNIKGAWRATFNTFARFAITFKRLDEFLQFFQGLFTFISVQKMSQGCFTEYC